MPLASLLSLQSLKFLKAIFFFMPLASLLSLKSLKSLTNKFLNYGKAI